MLSHALGNRAPDAARRAGDDGNFSAHVEQGHLILPPLSSANRTGFVSRLKAASKQEVVQASLVALAISGPAGWCIALCEASAIHGFWLTIGSRQPLWCRLAR